MSIHKHDFTDEIVAILDRNTKGEVILNKILLQSRVEFNVEAEEQDVLAFKKAESGAAKTDGNPATRHYRQ